MEYEFNLAMLILNAVNGDATSQQILGNSYTCSDENGLEKNTTRAIYWLEKSASQNNADALFDLWNLYFYGNNDIAIDKKKSSVYKKRLAELASKDIKSAKEYIGEIASHEKDDAKEEIEDDSTSFTNDYKLLRKRFINYLKTEWQNSNGQPLSPNSANSYGSFLNQFLNHLTKENNDQDFLSYPQKLHDKAAEAINIKNNYLSLAHSYKINSQTEKEKKDWNNRFSALTAYFIFLDSIFDEEDTSEENDVAIPVTSVNIQRNYKDNLKSTELYNKFRARLKTQDRFYPEIENGFYVPFRFLSSIFEEENDKRYSQWLQKQVSSIRILDKDENNHIMSDVSCMEIQINGEVLVTKKDGTIFQMYTKTSNGLKPMIVNDWKNISIDHIVSLESKIRTNTQKLTGLTAISSLIHSYNENNGYKNDPRYILQNTADNHLYRQKFLEDNKTALSSIRDSIIDDLNFLELEYELMDRSENSRKSNS